MFFDKMPSLVYPFFLAIVTCFLSSIAPAQEPATFLAGTILTSPACCQSSGPTVRWEVDDQNHGWIASQVALGDHGAILIAGKEFTDEAISLYSTASDQAIAHFTTPSTPFRTRVDAARESQTLAASVVLQEIRSSGPVLWSELYVWKKASQSLPDWIFRFPAGRASGADGAGVRVSDDGERVVAWFTRSNSFASLVDLRVFDRNGNLTLQEDIQLFSADAYAGKAELSSDGTRLLIDVAFHAHLFDLNTGQLLQVWPVRHYSSGIALSGDGTAVALGDSNGVEVYRENGLGGFDLTHQFPMQGNRIGGPLALDHDGSHVAYSILRFLPSEVSQVRVRDLIQDVELYRHSYDAPGSTANVWICALQMTEDAAVVAGGSWGDPMDITPTGFALNHAGEVLSEIRTPGSVLSMDMDPSGQVLAFGAKSVHFQNNLEDGGSVVCADLSAPALSLHGFPSSGGIMSMTIRSAASHARVVVALSLGSSPTRWGRSELDLSTVALSTGPLAIPTTGLHLPMTIPGASAMIGLAFHVQAALIDRPQQTGSLSNRVSIRVLP